MIARSEIETFDGRDNRREIMILLQRLGSNHARAAFIEGLLPLSLKGFSRAHARAIGDCDPVAAYFILVGVCNEIGVPINEAARRLDRLVAKGGRKE